MKTKYVIALMVALAIASISLPVQAAKNDDERIVSAAKESYVFRTQLKDEDIKVQSKQGVVTLTGEVSDRSQKDLAEDMVENLPGVKKVDNQLVVKLVKEHSDTWMEFKVKTALLYHRSTSGTKTDVSVKDGVVTLRGAASSVAQKELAEEYSKDIEGVKDVENEMTVVSESPSRPAGVIVDDASITAQVKAALLTHRSTSALKTKVKTREGVVSIGGHAGNLAEKDLVTKLATDINGVKSVTNAMEVKNNGY